MSSVPLHTRVITLRLRWSQPGEVLAEGRLLDLRKRSVVPLGASLRGPGVVHDMHTRVWIDVDERRISRIEPEMRTFPYVSSQYTEGEACTGRIADVQSVVGTRLSETYGEDVNSLVGGPLGCFHIFTLLRLTGPAVMAALADPGIRSRLGKGSTSNPGEVLWSRCVTVDSFKGEGLAVSLHGTLTDVFQRGGPPETGHGEETLESGVEVMAHLATGFPEMTLSDVGGRRRRLLPGLGSAEPWEGIEVFQQLQGVGVRKGFSAKVQELLSDEHGLCPESHLVFMMAPVVMQSMPGLIDELGVSPSAARGDGGKIGTAANSCHMWRSDGPLDRLTSGG